MIERRRLPDRRTVDRNAPDRRGRRPLFGEAATASVRIRLTPGQRADLDQMAADNHVTASDVIREALNEFVSDYRDKPFVVQKYPHAEQ